MPARPKSSSSSPIGPLVRAGQLEHDDPDEPIQKLLYNRCRCPGLKLRVLTRQVVRGG